MLISRCLWEKLAGCEYTFKGQEEADATALCLLEGTAGGS